MNSIHHLYLITSTSRNGKTPGITQPGVNGQEAVIRKTYKKAGLNFSDTSYVECHGTGTPVGDPIEVEALSRVFLPGVGPPLLIGAVSRVSWMTTLFSNFSLRLRQIWATVKRQVAFHLLSRLCLLLKMGKSQPQSASPI